MGAAVSVSRVNPTTAFSKRQAFDLSCLAGHDMGFVAARPAAIFRIPGMKHYAEMINTEVAGFLKTQKMRHLNFDITSIDQAVIGFNIKPRDRKKGVPGRIVTGAFVLRSVRDCDWLPLAKSLVRALVPEASELAPVRLEGRVYYTTHLPRGGRTPACTSLIAAPLSTPAKRKSAQ